MLNNPLSINSNDSNHSKEIDLTSSTPKEVPLNSPLLQNSLEIIPKISSQDQDIELLDNNPDDFPLKNLKFSAILKDFTKIMKSSLMISFSFFSNLILLMINLHFVGKFEDPTLVGAIGLGNVWINSLGINTIYGLNYGFEILASKAYGASNYRQVGVYFKKGLILDCLILSIFSFLSLFSDRIFIGLGQSPIVSYHLRDYVVNTLPALYFASFFDLRAIYFSAQEVFLAPVIIQILTTFTHYFWCVLFFDFHIKGIAYAMDISLFINFVLLEIYTFFWSPRKHSHAEWSKEVFYHFWDYLKIAVPIGMTTVLEEFSYEVNSLIAGMLTPDTILAAHVSLANIGALFYCLPEGFSTGINTYVGISLGEKKENKAKRFAVLGSIGAIMIMIISYSLLWGLQNYWVHLFIDHDEVISLIKNAFYLFIVVGLLDTFQLSLGAIVKVVGKGNLALLMYLICLYILANPLSYVFGITLEMGLEGIWIGILIGLALLAILFLIIVSKIDWKKEISMVEFNEEVQELMGNID